MDTESTRSKVRKRKAALNVSFCVKKEKNTVYKKVSYILRKPLAERSNDEIELLDNSKDIVREISNKQAQRQKIKDRSQEYEDPANVLAEKCKVLADAVINSNHLVVYTGAGISTAARIPDYRGSNGIWTLLQQGKDIGLHDLSQAEPTLTHMALYSLYRRGILKHIVSQNCDGLHLRSGLPKKILSEVHGNMYLEVCSKCKPSNHYWRLFDVTEYTARYSHETLRLCYKCGSPLKDTIVHFGERGKLQWPLNWDTACKQADKADVILCLGSSLKVLKKYPWLWCMDKPAKKRPKLYIVNLQWTPKDDHSTLKINGKCDAVIEQLMSQLSLEVPKYNRSMDPIFHHATPLHESEMHTTSRSPIEKHLKTVGKVAVRHLTDMLTQSDVEDGGVSMCSTSQDISSAAVDGADSKLADSVNGDGMHDDLIASGSLLNDDRVNLKEESAVSNTYSDKENVDASMDDDDNDNDDHRDVKPQKSVLACAVDHVERQSNLSVISDDLSSDYIVPDVGVVKVEDEMDEADDSVLMDTNAVSACSVETEPADVNMTETSVEMAPETIAAEPSIPPEMSAAMLENASFIVPVSTLATDMALLQHNALQWYFGRNPWSDLSLFDIFTQKPIFLAQPMLNFGASLMSYPSAGYPAPIFGSYFNCGVNLVPCSSSVNGRASASDYDRSNISSGRTSVTPSLVVAAATDENDGDVLFAEEGCSASNAATSSSSPSSVANESSAVVGLPETATAENRRRCSFCFENYASKACLFYVVHPSNEPFDTNSACLCCGGDDDDDDDDQADSEEPPPPPPEEGADKTANKVNNINPGWFGKGYRKKIKKRKG